VTQVRILGVFVVLAGSLILRIACETRETGKDRSPLERAREDSESRVKQVWGVQERVILAVLDRNAPFGREFDEAAKFFEKTTGIMSRADGFYGGVLPDPILDDDLARWNSWYERP